jgi:transposase
MVEAILFLARTGIQWRYLPDRYPPWEAVWQQWRRWRENGVWARAMSRIARLIRSMKRAHVEPTMGMIDAQTVRGGRAGPTFHSAGGRGGRTIGTKRSILPWSTRSRHANGRARCETLSGQMTDGHDNAAVTQHARGSLRKRPAVHRPVLRVIVRS